MLNENKSLTYKKIFTFWYPLAGSWLMMAIEGPLLASIIARLPEPKYNLAAYGIAMSFALIVEGPIIMLLSASTALARNKDAFFKLRRFSNVLNVSITALMLIILTPPVFYFITEQLIGLSQNLIRLSHTSLILLLPWPYAIGYRRFYQGILIRYNLTRRVAYGTIIRLTTMATTGFVLYSLDVTGAYVGAAALSAGVIAEATSTRFMAHQSLKKLKVKLPSADEEKKPLTYKYITVFYFPLAVMTTLSLGVHPMVTFFMGTSRFSLESLAVLPVMNALLFLFRSFGLSFPEVLIALMGDRNEGYRQLRNFAFFIGTGVAGGMALVAFTPLAQIWFHNIQGLSQPLAEFSFLPTQILFFLPALTVLIGVQRSVLVKKGNTGPITWATIIEVAGILVVLFITIRQFDMVGIVGAALAYIIGRGIANIFLIPHHMRALKS